MFKTIFFALCITLCISAPVAAISQPKAEAGELDLRHWSFEQDGTIRLDGRWAFYWENFIPPQQRALASDETIMVPGIWNGHERGDTQVVTGHGYASYQLRVLLPPDTPQLALKVVDIGEAFKLYVNGELLHSAGKLGTNAQHSRPGFSRSVLTLPEDVGSELNIVIHVSNYHYRSGGVWNVITLGEVSGIRTLNELELGYAIFLVGSIGFIALYHIALYLQRRQDKSPLYFGLFCVAVLLRILATDDRYLTLLIPSISYSMLVRLEYISFLLGIPAFAGFISHLVPGAYPRWMSQLCVYMGLVFTVFVMVTPIEVFSEYLTLFQIYLVGCVLFGLYVFSRCVVEQREVARAFLFGFIVLAIAILNDVLISMGVIRTPVPLAGAGMLCFIMIQSYSLSLRFARSFTQVEALSRELEGYAHTLESRVEQRTRELEIANTKLEQLVSVDGLTGIANRRAFDDLLNREWVGHTRRSSQLALILCDVDYFKLYNDFYGHLEGDDALCKVARCLSDTLQREVDTVARYGGEEFAVVLPDTSIEGAIKIAERINRAVRDLHILHQGSPVSHELTMSCGVAAMVPTEKRRPGDLVGLADRALYSAKAAGRDRVVAAGSEPGTAGKSQPASADSEVAENT
ncbi:MAG: diguanylate cyclase [Halioglobus sp.]|nr:diguanylate cyclase [Halioglobus sp.]